MALFEPLVRYHANAGASGRDDLRSAFNEVRALTDALSEPLEPEDQQVQSCEWVSPTKWHLAHTTWFFETFVLGAADAAFEPFRPTYAFLFNSYYQSVGRMHARPKRGLLTRPTLREIREYRRCVDEQVRRFIDTCAEEVWQTFAPILELGLHHEQQHQELILTDIKEVLSRNPLFPAAYPSLPAPVKTGDLSPLAFIAGPEGPLEIGRTQGEWHSGFSFDHEGPRHAVYLTPHALADRLVTNGEFLSFIEAGGYEDHRFWLSDGWDIVCREHRGHPFHWRCVDGVWHEFTLHGLEPLDPARPVIHVDYYEAQAYASWLGWRLPREAELEVAARTARTPGRLLPNSRNDLLSDLRPRPAGSEPGLKQLIGDVWEWTESAFLPYPGYRAPKTALGEYNGKFMSGQFVLRGGSFGTPQGHMRPSYRNFFQPESRWQFTGIRLAKDLL